MTQPLRVVIDPNVYVSAAITPTGTCGQLIDAVDDSVVVAVSCPHLLSELQRALLHPKLRRYVSPAEAVAYSDTVRVRTERYPDPVSAAERTRDPKDDYLVNLAVDTDADGIISGDPDLLTADVPIVVWSPRRALSMVMAE